MSAIDETWEISPNGDLYAGPEGASDNDGDLLMSLDRTDISGQRTRVASCAPEALRLLLDTEWGGRSGWEAETHICDWCSMGEPTEQNIDEGRSQGWEYARFGAHDGSCPWLLIMKKAGLR